MPVASLLTYAELQNKIEIEMWHIQNAETAKHIET